MKRTTATAAALLVLLGTAVAAPAYAQSEVPMTASSDIVYDEDGNVIAGDAESVSIEWEGSGVEPTPTAPPTADPELDDPVPIKPIKTSGPPMTVNACPEVNDKPRVVLTKSRKFIIDKDDPWSTWLLPGQTVDYTTESSHEFSVSVTVGVSAEAGAFVAKAASKLDIQVGYKYTAKSGRKLSDTNSTKKGYRVRLGNQGFRLVETKTWFVPPCTKKTKVTWDVIAPEKGDLSFGRFDS